MQNLELVIFDCDGVLVDSEPILNRVFVEILTEAGFDITHEEADQKFVGKSFATCLEIIEKSYGRPLPNQWFDICRERGISALQQELQSISGVAATLGEIKLPKCVASNSSPRHIHMVLELTSLKHHFEGNLYSCHDVNRPKPFPDVYLHAASQMGKTPEQCVVIEDSVTGVKAGFAAGMKVLAYSPLSLEREDLIAAGAHLVFADMLQLPSLLGLTN